MHYTQRPTTAPGTGDPPRLGRRRDAPAATRRFPLWPALRRQQDTTHPPHIANHHCDPPAATYPPSRRGCLSVATPSPFLLALLRLPAATRQWAPSIRRFDHPSAASTQHPCDQPTATHPHGATLATHHPPAVTHPPPPTCRDALHQGNLLSPVCTRRGPPVATLPLPATRHPPQPAVHLPCPRSQSASGTSGAGCAKNN